MATAKPFIVTTRGLTPALCGHASALSGSTMLNDHQTFMAGNYVKTTARGHGQHQCFVSKRFSLAAYYTTS